MNGDVKTRSLDALAASTNHMLKAIKLDGCNALGADLKKRIRRNQATAADEELIEYIYWRNFWHITRTLSRQSRLIETFKVLLRQLPTSIELRLRCNARGLDRPPQLSELIVAPKSHRQHNPHLWLLDREQTGPRKFGNRCSCSLTKVSLNIS